MKNHKKMNSFLSAALILFAAGCGLSSGDSARGSLGGGANKTGLPPALGIEPSVARVAGAWHLDCQASGGFYEVVHIVIGQNRQNRLAGNWSFYSDSGCRNLAFKYYFNFNLKDDGTADATYCDLYPTLIEAEQSFHTQEYITAANAEKYCSIDNWSLGRPSNILGRTCNQLTFKSKPADRITLMMNPNGTLSMKTPYEEGYRDFHR